MNNTKTISFPDMVSTITRHTKLVSGVASIEDSLTSLLSTSKGELFGDPNYGCNIMKSVYDMNDVILADILRTEIVNSIFKYENRIVVSEGLIDVKTDENTVNVNIRYRIKSENSVKDFEYTYDRK